MKSTKKIMVEGSVKLNGKENFELKSFRDVEKLYHKAQWFFKDLPKVVRENKRKNKEGERLNRVVVRKHNIEMEKMKRNSFYEFKDINFEKEEVYDVSKGNYYAFKKSTDIQDGLGLNLGNQCGGFDFEYEGKKFWTVENMYLCGQFSENTDNHKFIQEELIAKKNGHAAKMIKKKNKDQIRKDWDDKFMIEWMMYCVWQKCLLTGFGDKLKAFPKDAMFIEDSTGLNGATSKLWGTFNKELRKAKKEIEEYAELYGLDPLEELNKIHYIGRFEGGKNYMGKVLTLCHIALLNGCEPPIDYDFLRSKDIYLCGKKLDLQEEKA